MINIIIRSRELIIKIKRLPGKIKAINKKTNISSLNKKTKLRKQAGEISNKNQVAVSSKKTNKNPPGEIKVTTM